MSARTNNAVRLNPDGGVHAAQRTDRRVPTAEARQALLVLGMHRSGTSAMTRVLNLLGADLGRNLMPGDADNTSGYWENRAFVKRNDLLLRMLGMSWHSPVRMPSGWDAQPLAERWFPILCRSAQRQFGSARMIALKDPRLCRLAPLWIRVLEEIGFDVYPLLVIRHPREVAASLARRNGFSAEKSYLLWLQHILDAEAATRAKPRAVIDYAELIGDWSTCVDRIESATDLRWPRLREVAASNISGFLDPSLRHHGHHRGEFGKTPRALGFVHDIYASMLLRSGSAGPGRLPRWEDIGEPYMRLVETVLAQSNQDLADISLRHERLEHRLRDENRLKEVARHAQVSSAELRLWTDRAYVRRDMCKVYWRQDGYPYHEKATASAEYGLGQSAMDFAVEFPNGMWPDFVRIDPSEWTGQFVFDNFELDGEKVADPGAFLSAVQGLRLEADRREIRFAGFGDDPHIELDLRELRRSRPLLGWSRLSFKIACIGLQSEFAAIADRSGRIEATLTAQQHDILKIRGVSEILAGNQDQHAEVLDELADRVGASLSGLEDLRQHVEDQGRSLAANFSEVAALAELSRSGIDELHRHIDAQNQVTETALESMKSRLDVLNEFHERNHVQGHAIESALAEFRSRLDALGEGQAIMRVWMQRRSPRYWWRRWRH